MPRYDREVLAATLAAYREAADPSRAAAMSRYMRGRFPFFGIRAPERRAIDREVRGRVGPPPGEDALLGLARAAWEVPEREPQYMACDLLSRHARAASPALIEPVAGLIVAKSSWDTVDALAADVVGPLVAAHPALVAEMDAWVEDESIWLARSAIIHQLRMGERADAERLYRYALRRAGDRDFFIRKAIGWALRQHARVDPDGVSAFVVAHAEELSPLTRREAMKHLGGDPLR